MAGEIFRYIHDNETNDTDNMKLLKQMYLFYI